MEKHLRHGFRLKSNLYKFSEKRRKLYLLLYDVCKKYNLQPYEVLTFLNKTRKNAYATREFYYLAKKRLNYSRRQIRKIFSLD